MFFFFFFLSMNSATGAEGRGPRRPVLKRYSMTCIMKVHCALFGIFCVISLVSFACWFRYLGWTVSCCIVS